MGGSITPLQPSTLICLQSDAESYFIYFLAGPTGLDSAERFFSPALLSLRDNDMLLYVLPTAVTNSRVLNSLNAVLKKYAFNSRSLILVLFQVAPILVTGLV